GALPAHRLDGRARASRIGAVSPGAGSVAARGPGRGPRQPEVDVRGGTIVVGPGLRRTGDRLGDAGAGAAGLSPALTRGRGPGVHRTGPLVPSPATGAGRL